MDHVLDHKAAPDFRAALAQAAPEGIHAYFDNVGGAHLAAALGAAKPSARFALCGMISGYNGADDRLDNLIRVISKRLLLRGFLVSDHFDQTPSLLEEMIGWIEAGQVTSRQTVDEGIEQAPGAFLKRFAGGNIGKMLVRLG